MPRRKAPHIPDELLDQLLAGADAKTAFDANGLQDGLKKALAERVLNAEMDHHLAGDVGQIVPANPATAVRGPSYSMKVGKTPVLEASEACTLLDSIDVTTPAGLRDRALIALEVYSFARVSAAVGMRVEDVYVQKHRL